MKTRDTRPFCFLALLASLIISLKSPASEVITWDLTYNIYPWTVISGQNTNGGPVNANDSGYISLSATLTNSYILFDPGSQNLSLGSSLSGSCECLQDLWVYNQAGQNGPISITVTPSFPAALNPIATYHSALQYSLTMSQNGNPVAQREYVGQFMSIITNNMAPFTFSATNGDRITLDMINQCAYYSASIAYPLGNAASYTLDISANGFITNAIQLPNSVSTNAPQIAHVKFSDNNHTLLVLSGSGGPASMPAYYVVTSTNPAMPFSSWAICQTNNYDVNGGFSFSYPVDPGESMRFIAIRNAQ